MLLESQLQLAPHIEHHRVDRAVDAIGDLGQADRQWCIFDSMSDLAHVVEGYVLCEGCQDRWVPEIVARRSENRCPDCIVPRETNERHVIELVGLGTRVNLPTGKSKPRRRRTKTQSERQRERLNDKARERARKRLAQAFPDYYSILLAEERAALGLDPWPLETAVQAGADVDGSISEGFARMTAELERLGES